MTTTTRDRIALNILVLDTQDLEACDATIGGTTVRGERATATWRHDPDTGETTYMLTVGSRVITSSDAGLIVATHRAIAVPD